MQRTVPVVMGPRERPPNLTSVLTWLRGDGGDFRAVRSPGVDYEKTLGFETEARILFPVSGEEGIHGIITKWKLPERKLPSRLHRPGLCWFVLRGPPRRVFVFIRKARFLPRKQAGMGVVWGLLGRAVPQLLEGSPCNHSAGQAWGTGCPDLGRTGGTFWNLSWAQALGLMLPWGLGLRASLPSKAEAGGPSSWTLCPASCWTLALNTDVGHLPGARGHHVRAQPASRRWRYLPSDQPARSHDG